MIIKNTIDFEVNEGVKLLIYGDAGAGKTRLCATTSGTPLILSAESGLLSIRNNNIDYIEIDTIESLQQAYLFIVKSADADKYDWICIDSLSEIAEVCLSDELKINKDGRKAYGELSKKIIAMIKCFRNLKAKNVYMAAKMTQDKDEYSGNMLFGPMMPGNKLGLAIPYLFDEVFYLQRTSTDDKVVSKLLTSQTGNFRAKDRSGALNLIEEANLSHIKNKIFSNNKKEEKTNE